MENSPPGIQTMPSGAAPGGEAWFSTVGRKAGSPAATGTASGFVRVA